MRTSPEVAFFLWVNAHALTPAWVVDAARLSSSVLPWLMPLLVLCAGARSASGRAACLRIVGGMLLAWLVAHELRGLLAVPRPAALGLGMQWAPRGSGNGFPSMHAAGALSFAFGVHLARRGPLWTVPAWAAAVAICWSRLCLGLHFPMDVLCGGLIGIVCARVASGLAWRRPRGIAGSEA